MGNTNSLEQLQENSSFNKEELHTTFQKFQNKYSNGKMKRFEFVEELLLKGGTKEFWNHVFDIFDTSKDGNINFQEFILGMTMINKGPIEEKLKYAFKLFDTDGNGILDYKEISQLVSKILIVSGRLNTKGEKDNNKIEEFFKSMDQNGDGQISLEEFIAACKENNQIVEAVESSILSAIESNFIIFKIFIFIIIFFILFLF